MQRKNEVTIVFWFFYKPKNKFFSKTLKISAPKSFFPKNDKHLLFIRGLFQQVLLTWNENPCERSKKIEVEDRIQKTDGEDEETVLDFLAQCEVYGYLKKWRWIWLEEFARLGKALKWKIYYFIGFSAQASTLGVFFKQIRFKLGSTNLSRILRFNFSYETDFWVNSFVAQKSSEMSTLSGSSPVFVSQPLAAQTF